MTWTKTGDDFPDQMLDRSDSAYRLHHAATTYSNRLGLDGRIPKGRLSLLPVPTRTRRKAVVAELVTAGLWDDDNDAFVLLDYFDAQLSANEVALTREYNRIRQAIRLSKDDEKRADFKREERTILDALHAARELRRTRSRSANSGANHNAPSRPVPVPSRSAPERERGREGEVARSTALRSVGALEERDACPGCGAQFEWPTDARATTALKQDGHVREWHIDCIPEEVFR